MRFQPVGGQRSPMSEPFTPRKASPRRSSTASTWRTLPLWQQKRQTTSTATGSHGASIARPPSILTCRVGFALNTNQEGSPLLNCPMGTLETGRSKLQAVVLRQVVYSRIQHDTLQFAACWVTSLGPEKGYLFRKG